MEYGLDDWGFGVLFPKGAKDFFFSIVSRRDTRLIQPHIQWVLGAKRQEREAQHLPSLTAEVKNSRAILPFLHIISWRDALINLSSGATLPFTFTQISASLSDSFMGHEQRDRSRPYATCSRTTGPLRAEKVHLSLLFTLFGEFTRVRKKEKKSNKRGSKKVWKRKEREER